MATEEDVLRSFTGVLAAALSTATGDTWRVDTTYEGAWRTKLVGPDEEALLVRLLQFDKASICGFYPWGPEGSARRANPQIGVTRTRPVEQIAAEIVRRLLPVYRQELAAVRDRIREAVAAQEARDAAAAQLLRLPQVSRTGDPDSFKAQVLGGYHHEVRFRLSRDGSDSELDRATINTRTWIQMLTAAAAAQHNPPATPVPGPDAG